MRRSAPLVRPRLCSLFLWYSRGAHAYNRRMILPWREPGWVGAALLFAACALAQAADPTRSISLESAADRVPRYEKIEFRIDVAESYNNAFDPDEVDLGVRFTTPTGETVIVPAFWCQAYERQRFGSSDRPRDWFYPDGSASW